MFDSLQHLLHVLEAGTVTEAARRSYLSQPALSASIRRLEEHVGARLLDRGRGVRARPTAAGTALAKRARTLLEDWEDAKELARDVEAARKGLVRVAAGATACTYMLPAIARRFMARHPGVQLRLTEARSPDVVAGVLAGHFDVGVVADPSGAWRDDRPDAALSARPWREDELVVVGPPRLPIEAVQALPWVAFSSGSPTRAMLDEALRDGRLQASPIAMELGNIAAVKAHVREGVGRALVSRAAVLADVRSRRLQVMDGPPICRQLWLVQASDSPGSPAVDAFVAAMHYLKAC